MLSVKDMNSLLTESPGKQVFRKSLCEETNLCLNGEHLNEEPIYAHITIAFTSQRHLMHLYLNLLFLHFLVFLL